MYTSTQHFVPVYLGVEAWFEGMNQVHEKADKSSFRIKVPSFEGTNSPRNLSRPHTRDDPNKTTATSGLATPGTPGRQLEGVHRITPAMANLPLTPAASHDHPPQPVKDATAMNLKREHMIPADAAVVTPQTSPPRKTHSDSVDEGRADSSSSSSLAAPQARGAMFSVGADSDSLSREGTPPSGSSTPMFPPSRPFTPSGDKEDPYARSKRPPQSKSVNDIEPRFKFDPRAIISSHKHENHHSKQKEEKHKKEENKRHSTFGIHMGKHHDDEKKVDNSMTDLKRFFRGGGTKRSQSPAKPSSRSSSSHAVPRTSISNTSSPFNAICR